MDLQGQRILVTGATGFIGGAVARRLLSEGRTVRAMARQPEKAADLEALGAEVVMGDLGDEDLLERAAQGCAVVIHCAAQVTPADTRTAFEGPNVAGTENVLVACGKCAVKRFVHLSSVAVFGLPGAGVITDASARGPAGEAYSDSKFGAEEAVWSFCRARSLPFTIVRPSCVYGPGSPYWSIRPLKSIRKGKMLIIAGGRGTFNYVYIDNLVDAILLATADDRALGDAFIVSDGAATWHDFFGAYEKMARRKGVRSIPLPVAKVGLAARNLMCRFNHKSTIALRAINFMSGSAVFSQAHIEQTLGHRTRVNLEEGLRRTEAWFRETGLLEAA
ncbi:MAG TPA: NAD-dependent epimerase/dehydratase family protein [Terriglobia bacterium]|jgi:nucleoside-diphosphate-sugar epimerase|nr:NAD-dependent epimerase/dehydratase family protein [Terriglobia bacterium]